MMTPLVVEAFSDFAKSANKKPAKRRAY